MITGPSGTGKSRLAQSLENHVQGDNGFLVAGKFDQLERPETSYPLVRAMTDLIQKLDIRNDPSMVQSLQEIADTETLLVDMIPVLRRFKKQKTRGQGGIDASEDKDETAPDEEGEDPAISNHQSADAPKLLALGVCRLIKAICRPSRPLVLFLDDMQWAKPAPLEIVTALLKDQELMQQGGFMMLAACRGNEVPTEHHLAVTLRELEATGVSIIDIQLGNLQIEAVQDMVQDKLPVTNIKATQQLARHIWDQTRGNSLFTILFIRKIQQEHQTKLFLSTKRFLSCHTIARLDHHLSYRSRAHYRNDLQTSKRCSRRTQGRILLWRRVSFVFAGRTGRF
jgi:predicted ATPase